MVGLWDGMVAWWLMKYNQYL